MNGSRQPDEFDEQTLRGLAALADGSLQGQKRAELEARVASSPRLQAALERQRAAATALRGLELEPSPALRARIAAARTTATRPRRRARWAIGGALASAAAAVALVAVLVSPSGNGGPTVAEAARLSQLPATAPVGVAPSSPKLLAANVEGVSFPNWSKEFGWRQQGIRSDRLDGREASTVVYEHAGNRLAYTIVSGNGIHAPPESTPANVNGVTLHSFKQGDRQVVTWWRDGRTCVLSGSGVDTHKLLQLASWKGDGAVSF
jgi:hypothetical protein